MIVEGPRDISGLIATWGDGDEQALRSLMSAVYPELRRIARRHLGRRQAGQTLESAALANEAYLKLIRAGGIRCENRVHFLAVCSQIITIGQDLKFLPIKQKFTVAFVRKVSKPLGYAAFDIARS